MPRVYYSTIISAPIEEVWEYVRDFNALPKWHPGIKASEIEGGCGPDCTACVGSVRHFQLADDSWMRGTASRPLRRRLFRHLHHPRNGHEAEELRGIPEPRTGHRHR